MESEVSDELLELQDELDEKQRQLERAAEIGQSLVERNSSLEEECEDLRELLANKEDELRSVRDQQQQSSELNQRHEDRNDSLSEALEEATSRIQELEHQAGELQAAKQFVTDENVRLENEVKRVESNLRSQTESWETSRKDLEEQIIKLRKAISDGDDEKDEDVDGSDENLAQFVAGPGARRRKGISHDLSSMMSKTAAQRMEAEIDRLREQLQQSETAREQEAQARREATAQYKRQEVIAANANKDSKAAERREAVLVEEVQRLTRALEKERLQIGTQQSRITGLEAEVNKLNQLSQFSGSQSGVGSDTGTTNISGMVSLLDELQNLDDNSMQQERSMLEKQISDANAKADAAVREKLRLQRTVTVLESGGSAAQQKLQADVVALKKRAETDKEQIKTLDQKAQQLQAQLTDATARADGLTDKVSIISQELQQREAQIDRIEAERNQVATQLKDLRCELETARSTMIEKDREALRLKRDARKAQAQERKALAQISSGGGSNSDTERSLRAQLAELKEQKSDTRALELEEELSDTRAAAEQLVKINNKQKEEITRMYQQEIESVQARQALDRSVASLRSSLNSREAEMAQVEETSGANRREVLLWRERVKKQQMQVMAAQELDDQVQDLQRQQQKQTRSVSELEIKCQEQSVRRKSAEDKILRLEQELFERRKQSQQQLNAYTKLKKESAVFKVQLSLLRGRVGWDDADVQSGGKTQVNDIMFEHFHLTAQGLLINNPLLAEGNHDIVRLYETVKSAAIPHADWQKWLMRELSSVDGRLAQEKSNLSAQKAKSANQIAMMQHGDSFIMYTKQKMKRIKKTMVSVRLSDDQSYIETVSVNASKNEQPRRWPLQSFGKVNVGISASPLFRSVDNAKDNLMFCIAPHHIGGNSLALQAHQSNTAKKWCDALADMIRGLMDNANAVFYAVISATSVRSEFAKRSERVAVIKPGTTISVYEVRVVKAEDLPVDKSAQTIGIGQQRARVKGGWVSLVSANGTELLRRLDNQPNTQSQKAGDRKFLSADFGQLSSELTTISEDQHRLEETARGQITRHASVDSTLLAAVVSRNKTRRSEGRKLKRMVSVPEGDPPT